jgi:hypothetical protein
MKVFRDTELIKIDDLIAELVERRLIRPFKVAS